MHLRRFFLSITVLVLAAGCTSEPKKLTPEQAFKTLPAYDYPFHNPYAATVIGVPPAMKVDYSSVPEPTDKILYLNKRKIPPGFWYANGLKYDELLQAKPAPLVYVIGGTGADSRSDNMMTMAGMLYSSGFSVVMLPSPTHPDFIINASNHLLPGRPSWDGKDIYEVIEHIDPLVAKEASVTDRMLIGYSLGAVDALFTFRFAENDGVLRFSKLLLINPPLSIYSSMQTIDNMIYRSMPHGINDADWFIKTTVGRLSSLQQSGDALDFTNERLLLDAYTEDKLSNDRLMTMIGLSFRLSAANMIFTTDAMGHYGYVFPKNWEFTMSTPVDDYMAIAFRTNFRAYADQLYTRQCLEADPGLTKEDLIKEGNLTSYADYIAQHTNIVLLTNKDDIILAPGEYDQLVRLFGANAIIFPTGGHMGNLAHPAVGYRIISFMKQ